MEKVQNSQYPSLENVMDYLYNHGFEYSNRTLKRDIRRIREDFQVEITYDEKERGYFIDKSLSDDLEGFVRYLEMATTADLLSQSLNETKEGLKHLQFDAHGSLRGIEMLKPLLGATMNHKEVCFLHENFFTGNRTEYVVHPYLLKEYANRWYLIAFVPSIKEFRTFGVDRLHELAVSSKSFSYNPKIQPQTLFKNIVGLDYSNQKVETVVLSASPKQAKYLKSLPIHWSQKMSSETEEECIFTMRVAPNYEFIQKLLGFGCEVRVLQPESLISELKDQIKRMADRYQVR